MVGFEVLVNGKRLYTIGIGDFGIKSASVMHARVQTNAGPIVDELFVHGQGNGLVWDREFVKLGDEITIRIIETDSFDPGRPIEQKFPGLD
jgi:hypothetical protein